jgi:hypothetical protein
MTSQPASGSIGEPQLPKLDELPGKRRLQNELHGMPEMEMIGEHHLDVLRILPAKHRIKAIDCSGEQRHIFVFDGRAVQRDEFETEKGGRLKKLRKDHLPVVGGVSRITSGRTVFVVEADKASGNCQRQ